MHTLLIVSAGGFLGTAARYLLYVLFSALPQHNHFWATFLINFTGCFLIGFLSQYEFRTAAYLKLFLLTGILGGFTTYSAFGLETMNMLKEGLFLKAGLYIGGTIVLCLAAVFLGAELFKYAK